MTRELLQQLYSKLENEFENDRKNKTGNFDFFEEKVLRQERFKKYKDIRVSSKTMKNYYEKHVEGRTNKSREPTTELKNLISEYLEYDSYKDFIVKNNSINTSSEEATKHIPKKRFKKHTHEVTMCGTFIFISLFCNFIFNNTPIEQENYIIWNGKHYKKSTYYLKTAVTNNHHITTTFKKSLLKTNITFF